MKTLSFDTVEKYNILYEAMSVAECGYRGIQSRHANRIFDKLEAIGKPKGENQKGYTLATDIPTELTEAIFYPKVELEDPEFELLLIAFDSVAWNATGSRVAAKVYDWLHSIK